MNDLLRWYLWPWQRYAEFDGRSSRKEFWTFYLGNVVLSLLLTTLSGGPGRGLIGLLVLVYALALIVPTIAVIVRRFHDQGRKGWWVLLGLIPVVGGLVVLAFMLVDSQPGDNAWGANPKQTGP